MKHRNITVAAAASSALLAVAGCSALSGDSSDDSNGGSGSPVAEEIRSWDPCEVLDNLQPIVDYMQIEGVKGADDFTSSPYGEGLDAQAATCSGLVNVSKWEDIDGVENFNEGELSVGIIPWDTVEDAQASYAERTGPDQERRADQSSTWEFTGEHELTSSDWDEGVLITAEDGQDYYYDAYIRDGEWLLWVSINYDYDLALTHYQVAVDAGLVDGPVEDYASYQFTNDGLQQWLVDEYVPQTHGSISSRITQE